MIMKKATLKKTLARAHRGCAPTCLVAFVFATDVPKMCNTSCTAIVAEHLMQCDIQCTAVASAIDNFSKRTRLPSGMGRLRQMIMVAQICCACLFVCRARIVDLFMTYYISFYIFKPNIIFIFK